MHTQHTLDCFVNNSNVNVRMTYDDFTAQYKFANMDDDAFPVLVYTNEQDELVAWFDWENEWGYVA